MLPYIGITDFTSPEEVKRMLQVHRHYMSGPYARHRLGVGVMMSHKTLNGIPNKWSKAFPPNEKVADIFLDEDELFNVLHYADYNGATTTDDLIKAITLGGLNMQGLQLDMPWPDLQTVSLALASSPKRPRLILQVGERAMEEAENDPHQVVVRLGQYYNAHCLDYVLLDRSMGQGKSLDAELLMKYVREILMQFGERIGIVIAGGLGPETIHLLHPFRQAGIHQVLSIDAQSKLRPSGSALDPIDWGMAEEYYIKACQFFRV